VKGRIQEFTIVGITRISRGTGVPSRVQSPGDGLGTNVRVGSTAVKKNMKQCQFTVAMVYWSIEKITYDDGGTSTTVKLHFGKRFLWP